MLISLVALLFIWIQTGRPKSIPRSQAAPAGDGDRGSVDGWTQAFHDGPMDQTAGLMQQILSIKGDVNWKLGLLPG